MPWVSWALPATSRTFRLTGADGFAGRLLDGPTLAPPVLLCGVLHPAATSAAAAMVASRPVPSRYRRLRESPIEGTPLSGSSRRPQTAGGWLSGLLVLAAAVVARTIRLVVSSR